MIFVLSVRSKTSSEPPRRSTREKSVAKRDRRRRLILPLVVVVVVGCVFARTRRRPTTCRKQPGNDYRPSATCCAERRFRRPSRWLDLCITDTTLFFSFRTDVFPSLAHRDVVPIKTPLKKNRLKTTRAISFAVQKLRSR